MSFRLRLALLAAAALAIALLAAGLVAYGAERRSLKSKLDALLRARAGQVTPAIVRVILGANQLLPKQSRSAGVDETMHVLTAPGAPLTGMRIVGFGDLQLVTAAGGRAVASRPAAATAIPVLPSATAIAAGLRPAEFRTVSAPGGPLRIYAFKAAASVAGEVAVPLTQLNASLHDLRVTFGGVGIGSILLVTLLATLVARQALRPVATLRRAAENIIETGDLRQRVPLVGSDRDELARLVTTMNAMLAALERSVGSQRQLVADASHELRSPLTTLTTNLQLLDAPGGLQADDAPELVALARTGAEELTGLVNDLVELARSSEIKLHLEPVRLDLVAQTAADRRKRQNAEISFRTRLTPCMVRGDAGLLERAIDNLLDNAVKWSPPGASVELIVDRGEVIVRDEGPGIAAPDLPFVFDRFYRASNARGRPGAGLGLAIVRQIAQLHGGDASAASRERGAVLRLQLTPVADAAAGPGSSTETGHGP